MADRLFKRANSGCRELRATTTTTRCSRWLCEGIAAGGGATQANAILCLSFSHFAPVVARRPAVPPKYPPRSGGSSHLFPLVLHFFHEEINLAMKRTQRAKCVFTSSMLQYYLSVDVSDSFWTCFILIVLFNENRALIAKL